MSNEERGQDFLNYVAQNTKRLKKNLKKNITYNDFYFEDAFSDAVLKVYDAIVNRGIIIKDYEQYLYISSKWEYVKYDTQYKKIQKITVDADDYFAKNDIAEEIYEEEDNKRMQEKIDVIKEILTEEFGIENTELYIEYSQLKNTKEGTSYKNFSEAKQLPLKHVTETIKNMKKYIANSPEIKYIKSL